MFKKIYLIIIFMFAFLTMNISFADANVSGTVVPRSNAAFRTALVGIINQLQAMKPLLTQAEQSQPKNARVQLHFSPWQDSAGKRHSGLRTDLAAIQTSLIHLLNHKTAGPRFIQPLKTDFVSGVP